MDIQSNRRRISVLDHGYVEFVESWGSDERIIEAARMSTGKGFQAWGPVHVEVCPAHVSQGGYKDYCNCETKSGDEKLLSYLWKNAHATPFEMAGAVFEIQAPIFVFREWHRHRTQSYNELSARYTPLPDVNYIPTVKRLMLNAGGSNKQAGTIVGAESLSEANAEEFRTHLAKYYQIAEHDYQIALNRGVPKELARIHLPVGRYSRMRASTNLRNWLAFLTLRTAPAAQFEIRQFANIVENFLVERFPRTLEIFRGYETTKR